MADAVVARQVRAGFREYVDGDRATRPGCHSKVSFLD
jgi:hypothetical protein